MNEIRMAIRDLPVSYPQQALTDAFVMFFRFSERSVFERGVSAVFRTISALIRQGKEKA